MKGIKKGLNVEIQKRHPSSYKYKNSKNSAGRSIK